MGNNQSGEEVPKVEEFPSLTSDEVKRLRKRFLKLDSDSSGKLSLQELLSLPELRNNPLVRRVTDVFDKDGSGDVDFMEFLQGLSTFGSNVDNTEKLRFAFQIYDIDGDGFISREELFTVLQMMVGNNLKEEQLHSVVNRTLAYADKDMDGRISFEEFESIIGKLGGSVPKKMVVQV